MPCASGAIRLVATLLFGVDPAITKINELLPRLHMFRFEAAAAERRGYISCSLLGLHYWLLYGNGRCSSPFSNNKDAMNRCVLPIRHDHEMAQQDRDLRGFWGSEAPRTDLSSSSGAARNNHQ